MDLETKMGSLGRETEYKNQAPFDQRPAWLPSSFCQTEAVRQE